VVWLTENPNRPGWSASSRLISVPFPTPEGPHTTTADGVLVLNSSSSFGWFTANGLATISSSNVAATSAIFSCAVCKTCPETFKMLARCARRRLSLTASLCAESFSCSRSLALVSNASHFVFILPIADTNAPLSSISSRIAFSEALACLSSQPRNKNILCKLTSTF